MSLEGTLGFVEADFAAPGAAELEDAALAPLGPLTRGPMARADLPFEGRPRDDPGASDRRDRGYSEGHGDLAAPVRCNGLASDQHRRNRLRSTWRSARSAKDTPSFDLEVTRVNPPHTPAGRATGELEGTRVWTLTKEDGATIAPCDWNIRATRP